MIVDDAVASDLAHVRELARRASAEAHSPALSEQTLVAMAGAVDRPPLVLLARPSLGAEPLAVLAVDLPQDGPATAELVLPAGPGSDEAGGLLLDRLEALAAELAIANPQSQLHLWSHGRRSPVGVLAGARGYQLQRELWRLRREGDLPIEDFPVAPGVRIAAFRPGTDDAAWLAVNRASFADHPEQGRWTAQDLTARIGEEWFDPRGFFLAWDENDSLLGFHWTKIEHQPSHTGEVYVIGVAPAAAGRGLGSALLSIGLRHMQELGVPVVYLYVDGDNTGARALYAHRGFIEDDLDASYAIPAPR